MTQQGKLEQVINEREAVVSVRRRSACGSDCAKCGGCAHPEETIKVTAYNEAGAQAGDVVRIESESAQVLGLAGLLYLMPLALLIAGYFAVPGGEAIKVVGALVGLGLGLGICGWVSARMKRTGRMTFRITAVEETPAKQDLH